MVVEKTELHRDSSGFYVVAKTVGERTMVRVDLGQMSRGEAERKARRMIGKRLNK